MPSTTLLELALIHPNPDNPRRDADSVETLTESISAQGILQALTVAPHPEAGESLPAGSWIVIDGHRRYAAASKLGWESVPCVVLEDLTDRADQIGAMLATAREREPLTAAEEASGLQAMLDLGESVATIASRTGMSKTRVRQRAKVATLTPEILEKVHTHDVTLVDAEFLATHAAYRDELEKKIGTNDWAATKQRVASRVARDAKVDKQLREAKALGVKQVDSYASQQRQVAEDHGVDATQIAHVRSCTWDKSIVEAADPETRSFYYIRIFDYDQSCTLVQYEIVKATLPAASPDEDTDVEEDDVAAEQRAAKEARLAAEEAARIQRALVREDLHAAKEVRLRFLVEYPAAEQPKWFGKLLALCTPEDGWCIHDDVAYVLDVAKRTDDYDDYLAIRDEWLRNLSQQEFAWLSILSLMVDDVDVWLALAASENVHANNAKIALDYVEVLRGMGHTFSDIENRNIAVYQATVDADGGADE